MRIVNNITWETYQDWQFGFGLVGYRDKSEENPDIDPNTIFSHKLNANGEQLTVEQALEIKADCDALVKLLSKFYHEKDFVE